MQGLSLVAASGGHSSSRCAGLSLPRPLLLQITGSRRAGSVVVAHGPSCSAACGILPDQGSNPCPLHWQADSQPLRHQGSPPNNILILHTYSQHMQTTCLRHSVLFTGILLIVVGFDHSLKTSCTMIVATALSYRQLTFPNFFLFLKPPYITPKLPLTLNKL